MTFEYRKISTSPEVWAVIKARHHSDLTVFGTFSAEGHMMTEYGFKEAECPLLGADTRWDIEQEKSSNRINEKTEYWLCYPAEERERLAEIQGQEDEAAAAREADKAHRGEVKYKATECLVNAGIPKTSAKAAIIAISKGLIDNVKISY